MNKKQIVVAAILIGSVIGAGIGHMLGDPGIVEAGYYGAFVGLIGAMLVG